MSQDVTIADNVLMMTPFAADSADPKVQAFVKAYQDAYNATPTVEGVTGTMTWSADGNTNKAASAILYKNGVGTLFGQDNANDAAGADTAADAEA